jgi:cytochrome b pre-mRNA-processing protein 3
MLLKITHHTIEKIYQNIVKISRSKFFYIDYELDDSFETRFDLIIFHAFMVFYFYKSKNINKSSLSQMLFDYMFNDFENNLREMGFGDIAVNKKMKLFIRAFYGRLSQYSMSIDLFKKQGDKSLLEQTILNNIFKGNLSGKKNVSKFVNYTINNINKFQGMSEKENIDSNFEFIKFG